MKPLLTVGVLSLPLPYVICSALYYLVGRGVMDHRRLFALLLLAPAASAVCVLIVGSALRQLAPARIGSKVLPTIALCSLVLGFFCRPSGHSGALRVCQGLADRVARSNMEPMLRSYFDEVLSRTPLETNTSSFGDTGMPLPDSVLRLFGKNRFRVELYRDQITCLRLQTGGPFLRYGYYVGLSSSDIPFIPQDYASQAVTPNITAFAR
jgi:hypothetical protein